MKKIVLEHLIRKAVIAGIKEGVMDNLTTQVSRVLVNYLKKFKNVENIPPFKGQVNDLLLLANFKRYNGPLRQAGGGYNDAIRRLQVNIAVPFEFNDRQLSDFIPTLKNTIRHELEHYRQDQRSGYEGPSQGLHATEPSLAGHPGYDPGSDPYADTDAAYSYFFSPHEVEAWVMGMYKQAKTQKIPLLQVMLDKKGELFRDLQRKGQISREEAEDFTENLLAAWVDYAEKRIQGFKTRSDRGILEGRS